MKKLLDSIREKETTSDDDTTSRQLPIRTAPPLTRLYDGICIFCHKINKYLKRKIQENLWCSVVKLVPTKALDVTKNGHKNNRGNK